MEIKNEYLKSYEFSEIDLHKKENEEEQIQNDREISIFYNENNVITSTNSNKQNKQDFLDGIKSFFNELFNKFKKEESTGEENQTIDTISDGFFIINEQSQYETTNTVKMNDSNTINGEIDEKFSQSSQTGDCVLLSTILALSYTEKGAELIKNSIEINKNENGDIESYSVTFPGINETYTISKEELEGKEYEAVSTVRFSDEDLVNILDFTEEEVQNMTEEDKWIEVHSLNPYSNGDSDVLLLELAVEKCFNESSNTVVQSYISAFMQMREETEFANLNIKNLDGIPPELLSRMLTGNSHTQKIETQEQLIETINNDSPVILATGNKTIKIKDINNNEVELNRSHAFAIKTVTNDTITIVNPHDSSVELTFNKDSLFDLEGLKIEAYNLK